MEKKLMVHYAATFMRETLQERFAKDALMNLDAGEWLDGCMDGYLYRVVRSKNDFLEKLLLFDAELDDRAVEFIKLFHLADVMKNNGLGEEADVYFLSKDAGKNELDFVVMNKGAKFGTCRIPMQLYELVFKEYIGKMPDIRDDDAQIDKMWVVERHRKMMLERYGVGG